ncbi:hypothetical protein L0U85_18860 [Glycomyces sp. L485]|uniref:hypothetical protein n=1 Tax=Glycomyces sp. L485 TaxID=2909235 RepID=UPI001F4A6597|nr:hypothetical protein [Glycomyces sp. L485]MCH7232897.1 hypothetical protein [Glycomyces sp. L485]
MRRRNFTTWAAAAAALLTTGLCAADAVADGTSDELVSITITGHREADPGDEVATYVFDYEAVNHATAAEIVDGVFDVFELTPGLLGDDRYEDLWQQGIDEVAGGEIGLQWSVEVQALDADGGILSTTLLQSACGTLPGETLSTWGRFTVYDGVPLKADQVAEVVVDADTLEVLPEYLSENDDERCSAMVSGGDRF